MKIKDILKYAKFELVSYIIVILCVLFIIISLL